MLLEIRLRYATMMANLESVPNSVTTRDGLSLHLRHWPASLQAPSCGVVCLVHGLGEHIGRFERLASNLCQLGWNVVGYDHRGHGKSAGARGVLHQQDDLLHDLACVIDTVRTYFAEQQLALFGHSLGGLVVARFVASLSEPSENADWQRSVELCILSSPAIAIHISGFQKFLLYSLRRLLPELAVGNGLRAEWLSTDAEVVRAYQADPLVHNRISCRLGLFMVEAGQVVLQRASSWTVPTLLLYSDQDRCVDPSGSATLASTAPSAMIESHAYRTIAHEILNEPGCSKTYSDLREWLKRQAPSPLKPRLAD